MGTAVEAYRNLNCARLRAASPAARPAATGFVLLLSDLAALLAAGWIGLRLWSLLHPGVRLDFYLHLFPVLAVFLLVFAWLGLYPGAGLNPVEELRFTVLGTTTVYLVSAASIFLSKDIGARSRGVFLSAWLCSILFVPLGRTLARCLFARKSWWGIPVLVLGAGRSAKMVVSRLRAQPALGLKPVLFLDDDSKKREDHEGIPVAGPLSLAPEFGRALGIRHVLVAMPGLRRQELIRLLERMSSAFAHLIVIPDLFGMASLWVSTRDLSGVLGLEVRQNLLMPANRWLKRALDLAAAALLGVLALPVIAIAVLCIKWMSPGPALYAQEREGEAGKVIKVRKLRTMHVDADRLLREHLAGNAEARKEWRQYFKLKKDPRILPGIGRLLRSASLDELPQLWNVIRGEMSLVGPRPFPRYHLERFDGRFRSLRGRVLPGLTGLWQISARSDGDLTVQEALDTYYIRNWSLWLDLHILARTVQAVLLRRGAY